MMRVWQIYFANRFGFYTIIIRLYENVMSCKKSAINLANTFDVRHNHSTFLHVFTKKIYKKLF